MVFLGYFEPELVFLYYVRSQDNRKCDVLCYFPLVIMQLKELQRQDWPNRILVKDFWSQQITGRGKHINNMILFV